MPRKITMLGMPRPIGGAGSESFDTAMLWRKMGLDVFICPAGPEPCWNPYPLQLIQAGCKIGPVIDPAKLAEQTWLHDALLIDFAVARAVVCWPELSAYGSRFIHVPTHCIMLAHEASMLSRKPPTAVVYESEYQKACLEPIYQMGYVPSERQTMIHGAFNPDAYQFKNGPRQPGKPFIVGRLARPSESKWPTTLWNMIAKAAFEVPLQGECMGWSANLRAASGSPPGCVRTWDAGEMPVAEFLPMIDAMICVGCRCHENWSRCVLEAMAAGVVVIAENRYGFREQIVDGETGLLCDDEAGFVAAIVKLAKDDALRMRLASNARESLKRLADPDTIGNAWLKLFSAICS